MYAPDSAYASDGLAGMLWPLLLASRCVPVIHETQSCRSRRGNIDRDSLWLARWPGPLMASFSTGSGQFLRSTTVVTSGRWWGTRSLSVVISREAGGIKEEVDQS